MEQRSVHVQAPVGLWPPTWPMGLTMLRLLLLPVFLWLILAGEGQIGHAYRWAAIGVFAVMALTDKLDGYLARRLNQTSKLGTILDPLADKLLVACSVVLLSFPAIATPRYRIPLPVVAAIYLSYLLVVIGTLVLLTTVGRVSIHPRPLGKLGTALQLVMVLLTLIAPSLEQLAAEAMKIVLVVLWWAVPILAIVTCADYSIQGIRQLRGDGTPDRPGEVRHERPADSYGL